MTEPVFGPHSGRVEDFLHRTYGCIFAGDTDEMALIPLMARGLRRVAKAVDVEDLKELTSSQWEAALGAELDAVQIPGVTRVLLKYLGPRGQPHVPPASDGQSSSAFLFFLLPDVCCLT